MALSRRNTALSIVFSRRSKKFPILLALAGLTPLPQVAAANVPEGQTRLKVQVIAIDPKRGANLRILDKKFPKVGTNLTLESASRSPLLELKVIKFEPQQALLRTKTNKILSNGAEKLKGTTVSILVPDYSLETIRKGVPTKGEEDQPAPSPTGPSARMDHRWGLDVGYRDGLSTISGSVAFNAFDWAKLGVGMGFATGTTSFFGGVRGLVPGWSLSPTLGFHMAYLSFSSTVVSSGADVTVNGLTFSSASGGGILFYSTIGVDYQTRSGIHVAAGTFLYLSPLTLNGFSFHLGYYF
jgi:hypothetical protein